MISRAITGLSVAALLLVGCAEAGEHFGSYDAGVVDSGLLDSGIDGSRDAGRPPEGVDPDGGMTLVAECQDGVDNDQDGLLDCEEEACFASTPTCCVGIADDACCSRPAPHVELQFAECGSIATCFAGGGVTFFGSPASDVRTGRLVPGGDDNGDSGLLFDRAIALGSEPLELDATIEVPIDAGCGAGCLEAVALGLTTQTDLGSAQRVAPFLSVVTSLGRRDVRLLLGDTVVSEARIGATMERVRLTLHLDPNGAVSLAIEGAVVSRPDLRYAPMSGARIVVYGRSRNPAPEVENMGISVMRVGSLRCDIPTGATRGEGPVLDRSGASGAVIGDRPRAPGFAALSIGDGPSTRTVPVLAFEDEGRLLFAERTLGGDFRLPETSPLLAPFEQGAAGAFDEAGVGDPDLVQHPTTGAITLFYTATNAAGEASIGSARCTPGEGCADRRQEMRATLASTSAVGIDAPSVHLTEGPSPTWVLVARLREETLTRIVRFHRVDPGSSWALAHGDLEASTLARSSGDPRALTSDEIDAPALIALGGVEYLYFASRRGTRWSILMKASGDGRTFHDPLRGEPVLSPSGRLDHFDAYGVFDPAIAADDGAFDVYYVGTDGARSQIGRTTRLLPRLGVP